ncbi:MAG: hypothetical protein U0354_09520 [Candidatus Sericytochromatia bacterium]
MKKNFSAILLSSIITLSICLPSFSETIESSIKNISLSSKQLNVTSADIENSDEFQKKKAEIKYTKISNQLVREVYINGFRVNDQNLPSLINDKELEQKIGSAVGSRRAAWMATAGLGIPVGGVLLYMAAASRPTVTNSRPAPIGQFGTSQSTTPQTFIFGTLGAAVTLYAVVNSISLLNDMTGVNSPQILADKDVEAVVSKYNNNLKNEILKKVSNNLSSSNLSEGSNNIMILNVNKSF